MTTKWVGDVASSVIRTLSFRNRGQKAISREYSSALYNQGDEHMPAVGGCIDLHCQHSGYLLPPEVLLFEPTMDELFAGGAGGHNRLIFLNTPLSETEVQALQKLHEILAAQAKKAGTNDGGKFPDYVALQALRMLQYRKFDAKRTNELIVTHLVERVKRLPITEASVLRDLQTGFMYWHGRDRKCRPCLVIRIENMGDIKLDKERAVKLVIFVLEYAIRYAMVPGRVENWVVLLDLANASKVVSMMHLASLAATGKAIATTLESVYCGRMVWMKILNMPSFMRKVIESLIPAEKKKKVQFVQDPAAELSQEFEPNQFERRYGGAAPDVDPAESYPFNFFPNCRGKNGDPSLPSESLHEFTHRPFHEGTLWDTSSPEEQARWLEKAQGAPLTPEAAQALSKICGQTLAPCRDVERWRELVLAGAPQVPQVEEEDEDLQRLETVHEEPSIAGAVSPNESVTLSPKSPVSPVSPLSNIKVNDNRPASRDNPIYPMKMSV